MIGGRRFSLYRFRHALFRRWVYERLDSAQRSSRHDRLAEARRAFPEVAASEPEAVLARHLERGERPARAAPYRLAAADRTLSAGAPSRRSRGTRPRARSSRRSPPSRAAASSSAAPVSGRAFAAALVDGHGSAVVGSALGRLHGLYAEAGDEAGRLAAAVRLAGHHGARGEPGLSVDVARRAADDAERLGLGGVLAAARATLAIADTVSGRLAEAEMGFQRAEEAWAGATESVPRASTARTSSSPPAAGGRSGSSSPGRSTKPTRGARGRSPSHGRPGTRTASVSRRGSGSGPSASSG